MGSGVVVRPDQVSLGVLVAAVPRDVIDVAVAACGVADKRPGGKLPAHVVAYLTMAMSLFPATATKRSRPGHRLPAGLGLLERGLERADRQRHHPGP